MKCIDELAAIDYRWTDGQRRQQRKCSITEEEQIDRQSEKKVFAPVGHII